MSDTLVTVTATYEDAHGNPASGRVSLRPLVQAGNLDSKRIVTTRKVTADLDETGSISLQVVASDDADWATTGPVYYQVEEWLTDGTPVNRYIVLIPAAMGTVDLGEVQPTGEPPDVVAYPVPGPQGEGLILLEYGEPLPVPAPEEPYAVLRYTP